MVNVKKAVTFAAMSTMAISAVVAVNPQQADAATTAESLVVKAEQNKVPLIRAISVDYNADAKTQPWTEYNKAKKDYTAAKAAVAKLSKKERDRLNPRLDTMKLWIDRTAVYIDAISSGKKLAVYQASLEKHLTEANLEEMTAAYHKLSYEIKKQAAYLYKVYGQSTRQAILETYKLPAEAVKQEAIYPVSMYIEIGRLGSALEAGNDALAEEHEANLSDWSEYVEDENMLDVLFEYYMETVSPYYSYDDEPISYFELYEGAAFPVADPYISAIDVIGYYNEAGEEIYSDAYAQGYVIKDDKGYFDEEGYLTEAYAETGLPQTGTVKIQVVHQETNEVEFEAVVPIVASSQE